MLRTFAKIAAVSAALMLAAAPAATAGPPYRAVDADGWPVVDPNSVYNPSVMHPDWFTTPDQPEFWNPLVDEYRLISPYGTSHTIVCMGYRVPGECWQADENGRERQLVSYPSPMTSFGSYQNGKIFVYPGFIPGS